MSNLRPPPLIVPNGKPTTRPFFTIGHSTRSIEEFAGLLRESGVGTVVDIRSIPRSRTNPQFNRDAMPGTLAPYQIGYEHIAGLGGRRNKMRSIEPSLNAFWRITAFHNYADYALTPPFAGGFGHLRDLGHKSTVAIMCSEAVWWRCHRRIVTDYLLSAGERVMHILGPAHVTGASLTPGAVVHGNGTVTYPTAVSSPV